MTIAILTTIASLVPLLLAVFEAFNKPKPLETPDARDEEIDHAISVGDAHVLQRLADRLRRRRAEGAARHKPDDSSDI